MDTVQIFMGVLVAVGLALAVKKRYFDDISATSETSAPAPDDVPDPQHHDDWRVRAQSASTLAAQGNTDGLVELLDDDDYDVRQAAGDALSSLGADALPALRETVQYGKHDARQIAANALGEIRHDDAVEALIIALEDESRWVRLAAVESLAKLRHADSVAPLTNTMDNDSDDGVRTAAANALVTMS